MPQERDLFANFERMRREMDELFGNALDRGLAPRRRGGFSPAVDVYYASDPPRAVVRADLAGIDPDAVQLEVRGRELVLSGHRETESPSDDRVTSSSRSSAAPSGASSPSARTSTPTPPTPRTRTDPDRRTAAQPARAPAHRPHPRVRAVTAVEGELPEGLPDRLPVLPLRDTVTYPDTLTPLAVGQDRSIQLVNDVLTGDRMLVMLGSKDPDLETPGRTSCTPSASPASSHACSRCRRQPADPRPGRPAREDRGVGGRGALPRRAASPSCPTSSTKGRS